MIPDSSSVPLFPISPLFFFWSFLTCLSFPPSLGHIRLSCIPDIPAAYVRNSIWLLWPRTVSCTRPFPSLHPSPIPSLSARLHLVCSGQGGRGSAVRFTLTSPMPFFTAHSSPSPSLPFFLSVLSEPVSQNHMTARVEGLETGFYTWGNNVRDNTQVQYTKD